MKRSPARVEVEPLTAELRRVHLTVSRGLLQKLATARDALSHSHPGASDDVILEPTPPPAGAGRQVARGTSGRAGALDLTAPRSPPGREAFADHAT